MTDEYIMYGQGTLRYVHYIIKNTNVYANEVNCKHNSITGINSLDGSMSEL